MEAVGTIVKVVQEIVKAEETARQNRKRCLDLADRARTVGDILREDRDSTTSRIAGVTTPMRRPPLERLKAALDDALELVESQRRSGLGIPKLITSCRTAARFQDVETRITACVVDLGLAEQIAARRRDHPANAEAAPAQEPPAPQQGYLPQSAAAAPTTGSFYNQYLEHQQSLMQGYLGQSAPPPPQQGMDGQSLLQGYLAQEAKDAQSLVQCYLAQSAQEAKDAQSLMQCYLAQSAQEAKDAQSFMQGYLAQSTPQLPQQGQAMPSLLQGYLAQLAPSQQQQSMDVQSLLNGYGYFAM